MSQISNENNLLVSIASLEARKAALECHMGSKFGDTKETSRLPDQGQCTVSRTSISKILVQKRYLRDDNLLSTVPSVQLKTHPLPGRVESQENIFNSLNPTGGVKVPVPRPVLQGQTWPWPIDSGQKTSDGGVCEALHLTTKLCAPPIPLAAIKPRSWSASQVRSNDLSTPKRIPLPNIFVLGSPPTKPNRPPQINLKEFTEDKQSPSDDTDPAQNSSGSPTTCPVVPCYPLTMPPMSRVELEEEDSYDDIGLTEFPLLPFPSAHPSRSTVQDEGDEEMYEDVEEMWSKDAKNHKKQRKKRDKEEKKRLEQEKREQKEKERKEQEVRKKYKISGSIQVIHKVRVVRDCKGGKHDLALKQGETIEIVRITHNPEGRWLGRTQDGSYGYVKIKTVELDDQSTAQQQGADGDEDQEFPPPPPPLEGEDLYDDMDYSEPMELPPPPQFIPNGRDETMGGATSDDVYDDVGLDSFPPPPPMSSFLQQKPKAKQEDRDPKKQKKYEKMEKEFRKKFKFDGEIQVLYQVTIVPVLTNKKLGKNSLPLKPGEKIDVITTPVDNKLIGRNQDGKFGYVSTSNIIEGGTEAYDNSEEACVYDND